MENKVIYEVRLSKPVMVLATVAAISLLAIGAKPLIEATPAFAQSNDANNFFDKYNNTENRMVCIDGGKELIVQVEGGILKMGDMILLDAVKHETKDQYYLEGTTAMNLDFFFDFEGGYTISLMDGEELTKLKCD